MTKGCVGFNYDSKTKDCQLSSAPWSKAAPSAGSSTQMTCQKSGVHDEEDDEAAIVHMTTEGEQPIEDEYVYDDETPETEDEPEAESEDEPESEDESEDESEAEDEDEDEQ